MTKANVRRAVLAPVALALVLAASGTAAAQYYGRPPPPPPYAGGQFGSILPALVDVRNSYGRGDFLERWIDNSGNPSLKIVKEKV